MCIWVLVKNITGHCEWCIVYNYLIWFVHLMGRYSTGFFLFIRSVNNKNKAGMDFPCIFMTNNVVFIATTATGCCPGPAWSYFPPILVNIPLIPVYVYYILEALWILQEYIFWSVNFGTYLHIYIHVTVLYAYLYSNRFFNILIQIVFLFFATYFSLYCCVTCNIFLRGINTETPYLVFSVAMVTNTFP